MFEREQRGDRAVLVHPERRDSPEDALQEFIELVESAGVTVLDVVTSRRQQPDPRYYIGSGKAEETAERVAALGADLVLVNHHLSPVQERNLERRVRARVLDRTTLILDIFAQRARSHEGKLQVELAQLRHLSTRLVRGWTHLERQKGGIGLRGPGETQLETDRRLLAERVKYLQKRLEKVGRQRAQSRRSRQRSATFQVSLVGYTNAGKSTLFNALTGAGVLAEDRLFATLDPTARRIELESGLEAVLLDTVGFVRDLPHELVAAFKATLQESREADLLLHVIDSADPQRAEKAHQVQQVLEDIDAAHVPQIQVYNKIDLSDRPVETQRDEQGVIHTVAVSAVTGEGMEELLTAIGQRLQPERVRTELTLRPDEGALRARLYHLDVVRGERFLADGQCRLQVEMDRRNWNRLAHEWPRLEKIVTPGDGAPT